MIDMRFAMNLRSLILSIVAAALSFSVMTTFSLVVAESSSGPSAETNQKSITPAGGPVEPTDEARRASGEKIFQAQCASCHGNVGQGNEDFYPDPLIGDASIGELSQIIVDTMPEEDPELCEGEDAKSVATYIHHAFYSEAAQLRNRPPRRVLQRMTGTQLRNSLMNLYSHFGGRVDDRWNRRVTQNGVKASYYNGKRTRKEDLKFDGNIDVVDFDFKLDGPRHPDGSDLKIDGSQFVARFEGGLRVENSGRYELVVRSASSFQMTFGHWRNTLIDNHVQSAGRTEFRRTVWLSAGFVYPFKISLTQRKRKGETPPSNVSFAWVPPGGVEEIVPASQMIPGWMPPTGRIETKMPPDDRSYGFERGISVDSAWDDAVTSAAIEFADLAASELWPDYVDRHKKDKKPRQEMLRQFLTELMCVAHRGDETQVAAQPILDRIMSRTEDELEILKYAILLTVKSPRFLYPTVNADRSQSWQNGTRLALTLFDTVPTDPWLVDKLREGHLEDANQIRQVARELVTDRRVRAKVRAMFHHWLQLSMEDDLRKDDTEFAGFDDKLVSDLRQSLNGFLDEVIWSESSDFRLLLNADWSLTTPRIASFYGDAWQPSGATPSNADVPRVHHHLSQTVRDPNSHVGVLTHPLVMAKFTHHRETSPIHRGVFLIRHVLGRTLRPPNAAFAPLSPDLHPDLTTRDRVALQTGAESCQICHVKINPLGFAMEQFDAVGRFRDRERDRPIDPSGSYLTRLDETVRFQNARDLGDYVARSDDARRAFVSRVFQYFTKQPIAAYGVNRLDQLSEQFRQSGYNVRELIIEVAVIASQDTSVTGDKT